MIRIVQNNQGSTVTLRNSSKGTAKIVLVEPQSMEIERPIEKKASKRTFGTNITNLQSRSSLLKVNNKKQTISTISMEQETRSKIVKCKLLESMETTHLKISKNSFMMGFTECLPQSQTSHYEPAILQYLEEIQKLRVTANFLSWQDQINQNMREILVKWLVEVHYRFRLQKQTLFLAIYIIDKFLYKQLILKQYFQLLGITALFIAAKYEEIHPPQLKKLAEITEVYKPSDILEMESKIFLNLEFDLNYTSPMKWVEFRSQLLDLPPNVLGLCGYLLELCLFQYKMCKYKPCLLSLASIYLSNKILNTKRLGSLYLIERFHIEEAIFKTCLRDMLELYRNKQNVKYEFLKRKHMLQEQ